MSHSPDQPTNQQNQDPFIILYNCRTRTDSIDSPHKHKRTPHDYSLDRKSIILTRKMKAQIQEKGKIQQGDPPLHAHQDDEQQNVIADSQQSSQFFNENELEKGIPLSDSEDEDILYNRNEMSWASNYSKLEKTLFGMGFPSADKQQEQEQIDNSQF